MRSVWRSAPTPPDFAAERRRKIIRRFREIELFRFRGRNEIPDDVPLKETVQAIDAKYPLIVREIVNCRDHPLERLVVETIGGLAIHDRGCDAIKTAAVEFGRHNANGHIGEKASRPLQAAFDQWLAVEYPHAEVGPPPTTTRNSPEPKSQPD